VRAFVVLTGLSFGLAPVLLAQAAHDSVPELSEIVVTADRAPTPLPKAVATTTVISGDELRARGVYFLEQALQQVPGVAVVSTGSYGGVTSLFLRGGESDYVKILVDGVPVNQPGGSFDFGSLSVDNIERIEVVRGPVSVLYGSDAVTGVVQIFTRKGAGPFHAEAESQAGSFGTWRGQVAANGGTEAASYSVSLSEYRTDGIYAFNSGFQNTVASGALSVHPDPRTDLTFTARTGDNKLHFPTDFAGNPVDSNQQTSLSGVTLGAEVARRLGSGAELHVALASYSETDGADLEPSSPGDTLGFFGSQSQTAMYRRSVDARGVFQVAPRARVTAGVEAEFENLRAFDRSEFNYGTPSAPDTNQVSSDPPFAASRRNGGAYTQAVIDLGARSVVNLGGRLDDNQQFGLHATYRAGVVYALTDLLRVRGSVGSGFKEPSIQQNFANTSFEVGNPDLKPEQSTSWEIGLEQTLAGGALVLAGTWFDQRFRDLIEYNGAAPVGSTNYQNIAAATALGVELSADYRPSRHTTLTASYTWLHTRVDNAGFASAPGDVLVNGKPLIRRPAHSARLDARTRLANRVGMGLAFTYVGKRDDVDFRPFPSVRTSLAGYLTADLDASVDLLRRSGGRPELTATFRAENLFDAAYQTVVGFPGRPRALLVGATLGL